MAPEQLTGRVVQYRFLLHGWQTGVIRGASSAAGRASTRGASRSFDIEFDDATKLTGKDAVPLYASEYGKDNRWVLLGGDALPAPPDGFRLVETDAAPKEVDADYLKKLVGDNTKEDADNLIMFNWGEQYGWHASRFVGYTRPSKAAAKTKAREGVKTLWVNGRVQIISLEEGDRAEAQDVDLHRAEYGTKWMLAQRGE